MKTSTIAAVSVGTIVTGILGALTRTDHFLVAQQDVRADFTLAYAIYFDYRRQTDPDFRKALKRDARKQAKASKEAKEVEGKQRERLIKQAVDEAQEEGFPTDIEDREAYFMKEVAEGESKNGDGMS